MDKGGVDWNRRGVIGAGLVLAGCAGDLYALPDYVFSLTCWSARDGGIDFLLMNVVDHPIEAVNAILDNLAVAVRDETGALLTEGFVRLNMAPPRVYPPSASQRLQPRKALKAHLSPRDLAQRIAAATGRPLSATARYQLSFETTAPVRIARDRLADARVRSRSICSLWFENGRVRSECHGPLIGPAVGP